jgi:hypothetical protein
MTSFASRHARVSLFVALGLSSFAAVAAPAANSSAASATAATEAAPPAALVQRAARLVAALKLDDAAQAERVTAIVAGHYAALGPIHDHRDNALTLAKNIADSAERERTILQIRESAAARQHAATATFLGRLAAELTPAQIDAVKDGLTYGVLPNTFRVYQEMLPDLTPEQSRQLYAWLYEAREHAIGAGSAEEKHGWFGKYKGRINNYLSAAGIDMKAAEKAMQARRKAP